MDFRVLLVLLYMHYLVRKRRYVRTFLDLAWPILIFGYFGYAFPYRELENLQPIGDRFQPSTVIERWYSVPLLRKDLAEATTTPSNLNLKRSGLQKIVYYPLNQEIADLMRLFEYNIRATDFGVQEDEYLGHTIQIKGFFNESRAKDELNFDKKAKVALITFEDFGTYNKYLKYTIKLHGDPIRAASNSRGFMFDPSMAIQWAMNKAFLRIQGVQADLEMKTLTMPYIPEMPFLAVFRDKHYIQEFIHKHKAQINANIMLLMTYLSLILHFVNMVSWLSSERNSGHKELLRMNGVTHVTLRMSHIVNALPACVVVMLGVTTVASVTPANLPCTPVISVLLTIFMFVACTTTLAFVISTLLKNTALTIVSSLFFYMASLIYASAVPIYYKTSKFAPYMFGVPYYWYLLENSYLGEDVDSCVEVNIFEQQSEHGKPVIMCWLYLITQTVFLSFFAWYMDSVRPGAYGIAKPVFFLFHRKFWKEKFGKPRELEDMDTLSDAPVIPTGMSKIFFEQLPVHKEVGIKVLSLTKVFGSAMESQVTALDEVTCDIYKGEITVLLGHNGAGKTTLMSIITGMYSPTSGRVLIDGLDSTRDMNKIIKNLGLCPQHNLAITDLTVAQHIIFFGMLKGLAYDEAIERSRELLINLDLLDRGDNLSSALSGGMRRRLQLACALAAPAQTLILDEPTTGLDVRTRRELWNILLNIRRGDSTVVVSTHYMEEAEALGDRVIILNMGQVQAYATPHFLKTASGGGYRIKLNMKPDYEEAEVTGLMLSVAPMVELEEERLKHLVYFLPPDDSHILAQLFEKLEINRTKFGITHIGVGLTSMEEMFLRLTDKENVTGRVTRTDRDLVRSLSTHEEMVGGFSLFWQRFMTLVKRHLKHIWGMKINFILIMTLTVLAILYVTKEIGGPNYDHADKRNTLPQKIANISGRKKFIYDVPNGKIIERLVTKYAFVEFVPSKHPLRDQVHWGSEMRSGEYIGALDYNGSNLYVVYSAAWLEAGPLTLAVLSSVLASQVGAHIETQSWPLSIRPVRLNGKLRKPSVTTKSTLMLTLYSTFMTFVTTLPMLQFGLMKIIERKSGIRHNHLMTGVNPATHWCASVFAGVLVFILVPASTVIGIWMFEEDGAFDTFDFIVSAFYFLVMYAIDYLGFIFLLTMMFGRSGLLGWSLIISFFTGVIVMGFCILFYNDEFHHLGPVLQIIVALSMSMPMATFCSGFFKMAKTANKNSVCRQLYPGICKTSQDEFCC